MKLLMWFSTAKTLVRPPSSIRTYTQQVQASLIASFPTSGSCLDTRKQFGRWQLPSENREWPSCHLQVRITSTFSPMKGLTMSQLGSGMTRVRFMRLISIALIRAISKVRVSPVRPTLSNNSSRQEWPLLTLSPVMRVTTQRASHMQTQRPTLTSSWLRSVSTQKPRKIGARTTIV